MTTYFKKIVLLAFFCVSLQIVFGQTAEQAKEITAEYNLNNLQQLSKAYQHQYELDKQKVKQLATMLNLPLIIEKDGKYKELQKILDDGTPIYYTTYNLDAAKSTRTNHLQGGGSLGLNLMGQNMTARIWDAKVARITHQEYDGAGGQNRYSVGDGTSGTHSHSAHVAGTIMASGVVAQSKGMAPYAKAIGYDWNNDLSEATTAAANGNLISNHSYGLDGSQVAYTQYAYYFGGYTTDSRDWDNLTFNAPYYLPVIAAGNDGQSNYNKVPLDGMSGYDKLSLNATSKNTLVVADARDANINSNGDLISVVIEPSSSQGPTDDYRIKPDIAGNGYLVYSTVNTADNAYGTMTGTSMASPNVAGTLLLLQQHYNNINSQFMRAATLKGLAMHTADDAGPTGPDVIWGWGLLNAKRAAEAISQNGTKSLIQELTINNNQTLQFTVNSDNINTLMASISWTDRPGTATTQTNSNTPVLVNDLDLRITKGSTTYTPWKLTGVTTNGKGDNNVDPFERVDVANASGTYTITISHKGSLTGGSQNFSLIVTGITTSTCQLQVTSAQATAEICGSGSTTISANGNSGTTQLRLYNAAIGGTPISTVNGASGSFTTPVVSETTIFFVAAANSSCESERYPVTVTVNQTPEPITISNTITPENGDACNFDYAKLSVEGANVSGIQIYSDDFGAEGGDWAMGGNNQRINAVYSNTSNAGGVSPEVNIYRTSSIQNSNGDLSIYPYENDDLMIIDLSGYSNLNFSFKQKVEVFQPNTYNPKIYLEGSVDGVNYTSIWSNTNITGNINAQTINASLNNFANESEFYFRFRFSGGSRGLVNWYIDDLVITGDSVKQIFWTPTTGLYTDASLTTPYTGSAADTVYAAPSGTTTYTASTSNIPGACAATDTTEVINNTVNFIATNGNWDNTSNWSNNQLPNKFSCVRIPSGKFVTVNTSDAEAGSITVAQGGKLVIENENALKVRTFIKNEAGSENFIVESGGTLIQKQASWDNEGDITVRTEFNFSNERNQFNFVSSPVINFEIQDLFPGQQQVVKYKESVNKFVDAGNGSYNVIKGYGLYEPGINDVQNETYIAEFVGVPFNKNRNPPLLKKDNDGFNLIGNPYPSSIDLRLLYAENTGVIEPTFYFRDSRGYTAQSNDSDFYAMYNAQSETGTPAPGPRNAGFKNKRVGPKIGIGTGFLVQALTDGDISFRNSIRIKSINSAVFFGKNELPNRYWISFEGADNIETTAAVVYFEGGNNGLGAEDSKAILNNSDFYSIVDDNQLVIQGKANFNKSDVVPLGVKVNNEGIQKISISEKEGVFDDYQNIYLIDNELGIIHNLTEKPYSFTASPGVYNQRFEIVYNNFGLNNDALAANGIEIQKKNQKIEINSTNSLIEKIEVFNLTGRMIYSQSNIGSKTHNVPVSIIDNQIVVVTVKTKDGEIVNKKFINN